MEKRPWWQSEAVIVLAMVFLPLLGLLLMWLYAPWRNRFKWAWTGIAVFLSVLALVGAISGTTSGSSIDVGEAPTSDAATPLSAITRLAPFVWPFLNVISGPAAAYSGGSVTYRVDYQRLQNSNAPGQTLVFGWTTKASSFVSASAVSGSEATVEFQADGQAFISVAATSGQGSVEVTLRLNSDFIGTFTIGFDVQGTGIAYPEGTVHVVNTVVTAAAQRN